MENLSQLNDTVEWSTINKMDVIEGSNTIEDELNYLFKTKKATNNLLTNRRDVINKAILRGFKKYFVNLLNPNKNNTWMFNKYQHISKEKLAEEAVRIGLMNLKPNEANKEEFTELICWLAYPKITKKVKAQFGSQNSVINIISDALSKYSHQKLYQILEIKSVKVLFYYFICHGKEQFMNSIGFDVDTKEIWSKSKYS